MIRRVRGFGSCVFLALISILAAACGGMKVSGVTPTAELGPEFPGLPFDDVVVVEELYAVPDDWDDAVRYQHGLREAMRKAHLFRRVSSPEKNDFQADLIVRGQVEGRFEYSGSLNFLTWFPGPFFLMPHWRGNRYEYVIQADVSIVDARTEAPVERYQLETRHRLVHRSPTPFPILGAALILPGLIRGGDNVHPRAPYRTAMYEQAYGDLWRSVIAEIAADRAAYDARRRRERAERCGESLNLPPVVGEQWSEFAGCQTRRFRAREARDTAGGVLALYVDEDGLIEIHVLDGRIVRWLTPEPPSRRGPPPR